MQRDIVVIGASAGGVEALVQVIGRLPGDFPAVIFVVMHIPPHSPSTLPQILARIGKLDVVHPKDGQAFRAGCVFVAPPDHHVLLDRELIHVRRGPKENRHRPSVDALFRSAAYVFGPRVMGVVLTGALDDGTSGMWSIKSRGGVSIVQDPGEAPFSGMPQSVLDHVEVDHVLPVVEIAAVLDRLARRKVARFRAASKLEHKKLQMEQQIAMKGGAFERGILDFGELTTFTCPECHGALVRVKESSILRFRCHTGHAYTASTLLAAVSESIEGVLWQSVQALEEATMLLHHFGEHFEKAGQRGLAKSYRAKAEDTARRARIVHESVEQHDQLSGQAKDQRA